MANLNLQQYRFSCRVYFAIVHDGPLSPGPRYYTYSEGWVACAKEPERRAHLTKGLEGAKKEQEQQKQKEQEKQGDQTLSEDHNVCRNRSFPLTAWDKYDEYFPRFRGVLRHVLGRIAPRLHFKRAGEIDGTAASSTTEGQPAQRLLKLNEPQTCFELFGADFVLGADGRPWLLEVNRSPMQKDDDRPMMHGLLDLALRESRTPPKYQAASAVVAAAAAVVARGAGQDREALLAAGGAIDDNGYVVLNGEAGPPPPAPATAAADSLATPSAPAPALGQSGSNGGGANDEVLAEFRAAQAESKDGNATLTTTGRWLHLDPIPLPTQTKPPKRQPPSPPCTPPGIPPSAGT